MEGKTGNDSGDEYILKSECRPDEKTQEKEFSLRRAADCGDLAAVQKLLKPGWRLFGSPKRDFNIDGRSAEKGWTALHFACDKGFVDVAKALVDAKASLNARTRKGVSPLHLAAKSSPIELIKYLIKSNADVNILSRLNKRTPLMFAVRRPSSLRKENDDTKEICSYLFQEGADLFAKDKYGRSAEEWIAAVDPNILGHLHGMQAKKVAEALAEIRVMKLSGAKSICEIIAAYLYGPGDKPAAYTPMQSLEVLSWQLTTLT